MAKQKKAPKPKALPPKGFRDYFGADVSERAEMLRRIADVYHLYGFEQLESSAVETVEALGKFLPDVDRPNEGVFAWQADDDWLALRYDLTAPLARVYAQHRNELPSPYRRFAMGPVWRNEKPGPGRYRQFMQIDADTVGAGNQAADAEICMMAADCMEALGIERGDYVVRINNRKIMDGLLEAIGLDPQGEEFESRRLTILRAMDKYDRLGLDGVTALLGDGRKDESGDFTKGASLDAGQIDKVAQMVSIGADDRTSALESMAELVKQTESGKQGLDELVEMAALFTKLGYDADRLAIDPSVVRGLGYYTGPVYEIELTFETQDENGELARFGSVGGGGRYDDLVKRFKGIEIPATGISIGVSRLAAALMLLGKGAAAAPAPLVVVAVMDKDTRPDLMALVSELRAAGIRAEMYMGDSAMKAQLRYADARGARLVVIEGEDERAKGEVTLKDLQLGAEKSAEIEDNAEWRASEHAQKQVKRADLVAEIQKIISYFIK